MNYFFSILAGIIQGLTEFLPISSSGHLVLFHDFFRFDFPDALAFDVVLHLGTLLALIIYFAFDIAKYFTAWLTSFVKWDFRADVNKRLAWFLFFGTIPAAVAGFYLEDQIDNFFRQPMSVAVMLIVFGIFLYLADRFFKQFKTINELSFANALVIGIFQVLALVPGVSRSGITIIAGLSQRLKRQDAARFSFLLAIPIIFGAGLKKSIDFFSTGNILANDLIILAVGFISSAITGYIAIRFFLKFLENHSLKAFAVYRVVLGFVIIFIILFFK
ncbi:MAG: undecaprenyl-diphosphatase UppP [Parcubacteria group bacterium]|jgi:undecaprenyl-diphosphatase|nr:undecaprenyl-diphosphatase UppP [Parcubacteria group bacterium]|tara:strand:+ start:9350 stop:10171 length:822 start_codon:yes stop_codon:yes gene_type:complete